LVGGQRQLQPYRALYTTENDGVPGRPCISCAQSSWKGHYSPDSLGRATRGRSRALAQRASRAGISARPPSGSPPSPSTQGARRCVPANGLDEPSGDARRTGTCREVCTGNSWEKSAARVCCASYVPATILLSATHCAGRLERRTAETNSRRLLRTSSWNVLPGFCDSASKDSDSSFMAKDRLQCLGSGWARTVRLTSGP